MKTRSPQVWKAYDQLASVEDKPGPTYAPVALVTVRWLAVRPGSTSQQMSRVHQQRHNDQRARLRRLERLGLVQREGDGWWLTNHGREFVELIDAEGVA